MQFVDKVLDESLDILVGNGISSINVYTYTGTEELLSEELIKLFDS